MSILSRGWVDEPSMTLPSLYCENLTPVTALIAGRSHGTCIISDEQVEYYEKCEFLWIIWYNKYSMSSYIDTHRYNIGPTRPMLLQIFNDDDDDDDAPDLGLLCSTDVSTISNESILFPPFVVENNRLKLKCFLKKREQDFRLNSG